MQSLRYRPVWPPGSSGFNLKLRYDRLWRHNTAPDENLTPRQVVSVVSDGLGEYTFTFDLPITATADMSDAHLQLLDPAGGGIWREGVQIEGTASGATIVYGAIGGAVNCTQWRITAQPESLSTPVAYPQSGLIT